MLSPYVPEDVNTRQLPRILCLHGGGTNAKIFQTQCRVISRRLASDFRLCFAEAPFESLPRPDVLSVYRDCGPFKAWIRPPMTAQESDSEAVMQTIIRTVEADDAQGGCGPWVGTLGFSQGAKVAASLLFHQQQNPGFGEDAFGRDLNFGSLHAGRGPFLSFASSRYGHNFEPMDLLNIPTIHAQRVVGSWTGFASQSAGAILRAVRSSAGRMGWSASITDQDGRCGGCGTGDLCTQVDLGEEYQTFGARNEGGLGVRYQCDQGMIKFMVRVAQVHVAPGSTGPCSSGSKLAMAFDNS